MNETISHFYWYLIPVIPVKTAMTHSMWCSTSCAVLLYFRNPVCSVRRKYIRERVDVTVRGIGSYICGAVFEQHTTHTCYISQRICYMIFLWLFPGSAEDQILIVSIQFITAQFCIVNGRVHGGSQTSSTVAFCKIWDRHFGPNSFPLL